MYVCIYIYIYVYIYINIIFLYIHIHILYEYIYIYIHTADLDALAAPQRKFVLASVRAARVPATVTTFYELLILITYKYRYQRPLWRRMYTSASPTRNSPLPGPYNMTIRRVLWWS